MTAPAKSSVPEDACQAQGIALGDMVDAYDLLLEQARVLVGLDAVLQTLIERTGDHHHKGLLCAAQMLVAVAHERCQFAQGELESLARERQAAAEAPNA